MAYLQLPLIPLNFVFSRLAGYSPLIHPVLAVLSFSPPLRSHSYPRRNGNAYPRREGNGYPGRDGNRYPRGDVHRLGLGSGNGNGKWPPTPTPQLKALIVITLYHRALTRLSAHIFGTSTPSEYDDDDRVWADEDEEGMVVARGAQAGHDHDQAPPEHQAPPDRQRNNNNNHNVRLTLHIQSATAFGRTLASALLVPLLASRPPAFVWACSRAQSGSRLKAICMGKAWCMGKATCMAKAIRMAKAQRRRSSRRFGAGQQLDAVWWRNSVGYLVKRERETRKVRDLPFAEGRGE
ncbi:hypothetical protein CYLTODRAFT_457717 [Cylindrobasidium torrendii FP15055 ss-10]|uniref:Uncharacterized protein n=1 Tax=Cylindrobasidium torrendii FP15055 ss-10 TaxID=1314674 RepID=A0A0D7AZS5_9AGAR|nr:hypothetical protein CYLTODRAFT_457717 [Cylindrobasidium torrendii FP15055 ss-10]